MSLHSPAHIYKIRPAKIDELLTWYSKQEQTIRLKIHETKIQIFRTWKSNADTAYKQNEIDYAALIAGIISIKNQIEKCKTSNGFELRVTAIDKIKRRKSTVADKIENDLLPLIKELRNKNLSWAEISEYIRKYHRRKISKSYLHKICSIELNEGKESDLTEQRTN